MKSVLLQIIRTRLFLLLTTGFVVAVSSSIAIYSVISKNTPANKESATINSQNKSATNEEQSVEPMNSPQQSFILLF